MIYFNALGSGMLLGLLLAVMIGPVFFSLIQNSIEKGFAAGAYMAIGIVVSDALYILIAYFGISQLVDVPIFQFILGLAGGLILLIFGFYSFFKPLKRPKRMIEASGNRWRQISKGFMLNGINPFVLLFWIGVVGIVTINKEYNSYESLWFFVGILIVVFVTDLLKSYLANRLSNFLTIRLMRRLNQLVGIALAIFSTRLFYHAFLIFADL
jgi:threonine/homoserine/homoserine lactone efflux protein